MRIRTIMAITGAALAVAGAVACGGGTPHPAPTTRPTTAAPTTRPTTTPPTTKPPTMAPTTPPVNSDPPTAGGGAGSVSLEQRNAIGTAHDYLAADQHFSRSGLIDQLKYEGYSSKVATTAVDSLHVNWNEQAAGSAKDYLETQHFSRSGLISQLKYEGYTTTQATYGVKQAGL